MKKTEEKLLLFLKDKNLIKENDKVLIGFSGGPDSVLLLYFFNKISKKKNFNIAAFHLNHNLRSSESEDDEVFCKKYCEENNIEFYSESINIKDYAKKNKLSIEEAARDCRYNLFDKYAKISDANLIATAHNKNDNVETVLFNLFRGTGISGMKGIPVKRNNIIRPILCLSRNEILSYLENLKVEYRIDSSNLKNDYKRNYIRNVLIPEISKNLNNNILDSINDFSQIFTALHNYLDNETQDRFDSYVKIENEIIRLDLKIYQTENQIFIAEIIKRIFTEFLKLEFENNDLTKLNKLAINKTGKQELLKNNYLACKERNEIVFVKVEDKKENIPIKLEIGKKIKYGNRDLFLEVIEKKERNEKKKNVEYFDYSKIKNQLTVRFWNDGDYFHPLDMKNSKKISDFLQEQKVESYSKRKQIVVCNGNEIIWLVSHRIDDKYKINKETEKILKIKVE